MAKPFSKLRAKMSPAVRQRSAVRTRKLIAAMPLHELRQAVQMSQDQPERKLLPTQTNTPKIERRTAGLK